MDATNTKPTEYEYRRSQIVSGDVLAWRGRGPFSWLISFITRSPWTHVGVVWKYQERLFVLEATPLYGVRMRALSDSLPFDWINTNAKWTKKVEMKAFAELGKPYSIGDAIRAGFGWNLKARARICSSYVTTILAEAGLISANFDNSPTPNDIIQELLNAGAAMQRLTG